MYKFIFNWEMLNLVIDGTVTGMLDLFMKLKNDNKEALFYTNHKNEIDKIILTRYKNSNIENTIQVDSVEDIDINNNDIIISNKFIVSNNYNFFKKHSTKKIYLLNTMNDYKIYDFPYTLIKKFFWVDGVKHSNPKEETLLIKFSGFIECYTKDEFLKIFEYTYLYKTIILIHSYEFAKLIKYLKYINKENTEYLYTPVKDIFTKFSHYLNYPPAKGSYSGKMFFIESSLLGKTVIDDNENNNFYTDISTIPFDIDEERKYEETTY